MRCAFAVLIGVALGYGFRRLISRKLVELRDWVWSKIT